LFTHGERRANRAHPATPRPRIDGWLNPASAEPFFRPATLKARLRDERSNVLHLHFYLLFGHQIRSNLQIQLLFLPILQYSLDI
jgi:hypothetical protein